MHHNDDCDDDDNDDERWCIRKALQAQAICDISDIYTRVQTKMFNGRKALKQTYDSLYLVIFYKNIPETFLPANLCYPLHDVHGINSTHR